MSDRRPSIMTGGCQCGAVRYALYAQPTGANICHCRMCQKAFGNLFAAFTGVQPKDFAWTRGEPGIFNSSDDVERGFCRDCGTPLSFRNTKWNRICISIGSLDDPSQIRIEKQFSIDRRVPDFEVLHTIPVVDTDEEEIQSRQHPDHD
ncbi:GFA family protein [Microvirga solisilvae]|uniref:GFA family protein n=1 Tax=Microvirga solisilvae TaxID=2919498 RepID=UPI001FAFFAC9|nr:GFA family protein [Microvirga solisilvae]